MMKKGLFSKIAVAMFCAVALAGCTDTTVPPTPTPPTPVPPTPIEDPVKESFTTYFNSTVDTEYLTTNTSIEDIDGYTRPFDTILERQIEVVSNDILYRLFAVYGVGVAPDQQGGSEYTLTYNDGTTYSLNSNNAIIQNDHVIQTPSTYYGSDPAYEYTDGTEVWYSNSYARNNPDISEIASLAFAFRSGNWNLSDLIAGTFFLENAMQGGYSLNEYNNFDANNFSRTDYSWNWNYDGLGITTNTEAIPAYSAYYNTYYDTLKTAVANLLATGSASGYSFTTAISNIDHNGFTTTDITNITNYVKNTIIGSTLISYDNGLLSNIENALGGTVLTSSNASNLTTDDRYYKAYSLLIPQLVKQAVNNVFENTTTNLYELQTTERVVEATSSVSYSSVSNKNFTQVVVTPKYNTPLTKFLLKFTGTDVDELSVTYTVKTTSSNTLISNRTLSVSNNLEKTIDLTSYYDSYTFSSTGSITFNIVNSGGSAFAISFTGYYDKA